MERMVLPVLLKKNAFMPIKAHEEDAGYDLLSPEDVVVKGFGSAVIDTGVHIFIPSGYAGRICAKSGLNVNHNIISTGLIDAGYTGSIRVKLYNLSNNEYIVKRGDKISQIMFIPIESPWLIKTDAFPETERGDNGFGSSGR